MEKWFIKNKKADFGLIAKTFGVSEVLARLAVNRGVKSNEEMMQYLNPSIENIPSPLLMKDMEKCCDILKKKIEEKKLIRIIGDYDVDGVMSTYILYCGLERCGAKVDYEIPDRMKDGYGINVQLIEEAIESGVDTILTCDNGISAKQQIQHGKEQGLTILVTDHHDVPIDEGVPEADAVVNPKQEDCNYPFEGICGASVAFKLVSVLYQKYGIDAKEMEEFIPFAAIATVCDVMDLVGENRAIVKEGLGRISKTKNLGLKALIEETGLTGKEITAYHLGFIIGPCINASGRLESAKLGLSMLLSKEEKKASDLAKELKKLNDERKEMTAENLEKAIEQVENSDLMEDKVLVIYLPECHESLAGIIAGRLRERYNKPSIVLTKAKDGVKGSGRSIEEYHMFQELSKCKNYLTKFGGHPMAAGLSLEEENIEPFREALNQQTALTEEDLIPKISFDMVLPLETISIPLIREMELLEPYGKANQRPLFAIRDVIVTKASVIGKLKNMLRLTIKTTTGAGIYIGMLFRDYDRFVECVEEKHGTGTMEQLINGTSSGVGMDFIFYPSVNEYNGYESIQIIIETFR